MQFLYYIWNVSGFTNIFFIYSMIVQLRRHHHHHTTIIYPPRIRFAALYFSSFTLAAAIRLLAAAGTVSSFFTSNPFLSPSLEPVSSRSCNTSTSSSNSYLNFVHRVPYFVFCRQKYRYIKIFKYRFIHFFLLFIHTYDAMLLPWSIELQCTNPTNREFSVSTIVLTENSLLVTYREFSVSRISTLKLYASR